LRVQPQPLRGDADQEQLFSHATDRV
jgi:hypothetical protein